MRYLLFICALCCAGCASMNAVPRAGYTNAPAAQPGSLVAPTPMQPLPDPASGQSRTQPRPTTPNAAPGGQSLTLSRPQTPPPYQPQPSQPPATRPGTTGPVSPGAAPNATTRTPAAVEPTEIHTPPTIPDPNAAVPPTTQQANNAAVNPQRVNTTEASKPGILTGWRQVSLSSGQRPIEMLQLGRGSKHLVIMGSLYGNERDSVEFLESLAELLVREPQRLGDYSIVLIRSPNPDGLAEGTLTNSRGVSLNRNFPSANFFTQRTTETGLTEASEPETQTILHLCDDFRPDRIVHVRAGQGARVLVLSNNRAAEGLRERIDRELMDGWEFESYKAGSIEEFANEKQQSELLLLWLPSDASQWRAEIPRLAAVIVGAPASSIRPASRSPEAGSPVTELSTADVKLDAPKPGQPPDLFAPYQSPAAKVDSLQAAIPRGKKGYVELLPPPPEYASDPKGRDAKYFELPPPE